MPVDPKGTLDKLGKGEKVKPDLVDTGGGKFVPAKSIKEATEYAKKYIARKVNFGEIDLEVANEVNGTLKKLITDKGRAKLGGLLYGGDKLRATAQVDGDRIVMSHWMKNKKLIDASFGVNSGRVGFIKDRLSEYREELRDGGIDWRTDALYKKKKIRFDKAVQETRDAKNRREYVANNAGSLITHEFGHIQENRAVARALDGIPEGNMEEMMAAMRKLRKASPDKLLNDKKVADTISVYARTNDSKHLAEAYVAWKEGLGDRVHPDVLAWVKKLDADDIEAGITPADPKEEIF